MKPGNPSGPARGVPAALPSAAAVIAAALVQTASADTRRGTLDVRVTVVDSCAADSRGGGSDAALEAGCRDKGRATVVIEDAALAAARASAPAAAGAPVLATEEAAGPDLRYVTIIY